MAYKKIPLDIWKNLSQEERDYHTLEFNKSVEKRKRITIIFTRGIAIGCILMLFFIGYAQFKAAGNYNKIFDQYGSEGYCYLCGMNTLKTCGCQTSLNPKDVIEHRDEIANRTALDNVKDQFCRYTGIVNYGDDKLEMQNNNLNISGSIFP